MLRIALLVVLAGCGSPAREPPRSCDWEAAPDLDPDPDVVEVELDAAPHAWDPGTGVPLEDGFAFNDRVPGPTIEVTRGQTLRIHVTNHLPFPTTIHWHGLRVPDEMDGVLQMDDPIQPGETFLYEFEIRDAGFYWYHPHMDTREALEKGLYGAIVAREVGEARPSCEVPIVLDDILLDPENQVALWNPVTSPMGRLGQVLLANGRSDTRIPVAAGQAVVLRLVNAANARYLGLTMEEHSLELLATDGGWLDAPFTADELVLGPGERAIVRIPTTGEPGRSYALQTNRVHLHEIGGEMKENDPLGEGPTPMLWIDYADDPVEAEAWSPPAADVPSLTPVAPTHRWVLTQDEAHENFIDGAQWPDVPLVTAPGNTLTTFEVSNESEMRHPFHIHGNRFQVAPTPGVPTPAGWKDTFDVRPGTVITLTSELDNPGMWMVHCHILEHADAGMAGMLEVDP